MPFFVLPDAGVAPVIEFIQEAQGDLIINNYFLDDREVLAAIRVRVAEGGRVYLILEPAPYGIDQDMVAREFQAAKATGAYVVYPPAAFTTGEVFDHAKYAVAQNEALIGTANWDHAAFTRNREFLYVTRAPGIVGALQQLAIADIKQVVPDTASFPADLTISPGSADQISPVLSQDGPVSVETEELQPGDPLFSALAAKGGEARVIVPGPVSGNEEEAVSQLQADGVQVRELPKYPIYLHAKIIVGQSEGWIGSQNFSTTSLNANREVGIILHEAGDLGRMQSVFDGDWSNATVASP